MKLPKWTPLRYLKCLAVGTQNADTRSAGPSALDLFAGAGGLSIGLSRAGFHIDLAVELDELACSTYASLHPKTNLAPGDIREMSFHHLRGQIALVAGGPPCQPFSSGGKRLAAHDPRDCIPEFLRVVKEVKPDAFLMENVAGLAAGSRRSYFSDALSQFKALGFEVSWAIINAADYGVPQKRRRLFVVGLRTNHFEFPRATHGPTGRYEWRKSGSVITLDKVLGESNRSIVTYAKNPDMRPSPYDGLLFNGGGRPINLEAPAPTILATAGGNKTPFVDTLGIVPPYHAALLEGQPPRQGTVEGARRITVLEAAALQTFPRTAKFFGPRSSQYTLVGNAVPPRLAKTMSVAVIKHLQREAKSNKSLREAA